MKKYILLVLGLIQLSFTVAQNQNTSIFKQQWAWLGLDYSQVKLIGAEGFSDIPKIKEYYFDKWNSLMATESSKYNIPKNMRLRSVNHYPSFFEMRNASTKLEGILVKERVHLSISEIEKITETYNFEGIEEDIALILIVESLNKRNNYGSYWATVVNTNTNKIIFTERMTGIPNGFGFRNYWAGSIYNVMKQFRLKKWHKKY